MSGWITEALQDVAGIRPAIAEDRLVLSQATDGPPIDIPGFTGSLTPYQRAGVAYLAGGEGAICADEMGLGKTVQQLAVLAVRRLWPAAAVVPASLKRVWAGEARRFFPGLKVGIVEGTRPLRSYDADLVIVNPEILAAHVDRMAPAAVVFDETHMFRNPRAAWTKAAKRLVAKDPLPAVWCLTGTPAVTDVEDLASMLELIRALPAFGGLDGFRRRYGDGRHLEALNWRLRASGLYLRRTLRQVEPGLDVKEREVVRVPLSQSAADIYRRTEANLLWLLAGRARAGAQVEAPGHVAALTRVGYLSRIAGLGKVPAVVAWVRRRLAEVDTKVLVFAHHRGVLSGLADGLGAPLIMGGVGARERARVVGRFQNDPACRVAVLSVGAAGVGLTLTAAWDVVFAEPVWVPAHMQQAEGRAYGRRNDPHSVRSWVMLGEGTIDEHVWDVMSRREPYVGAVIDGAVQQQQRLESVRAEVLERLEALADPGR